MAITTLNTNPNSAYTLDDFDETKNYHRVLFKPGVAVQARELTQMQTAIQRQIDYHGQYSFSDGARVVGGKLSLNTEYDFIKVEDAFTTGSTGFITSSYMADYKGSVIQGTTSTVKAKVLQVINAAGTDVNDATKTGILANESGDAITLFVQYIEGDADPSDGSGGTYKKFVAGEVIKLLDTNGSEITAKKTRVGGFGNGDTLNGGSASTATAAEFIGTAGAFVDDATNDSNITAAEAVGSASAVNIEEGAYFIKGTFVHVKDQTLILDKYSNSPTYIIGLQVTESVVGSTTDATLNDNAAGTTNLSAPGADRYKINTKLIKTANDATPNSEFASYVLLMTVENGIVSSDKSSGDAKNTTELTARLARRTFEESGNYTTSAFEYEAREYLNNEGGNNGFKTAATIISDESTVGNTAEARTFGNNRLAFGIQPNTMYIDGFRVENTKTRYVTVEKPRTETLTVTDTEREINYGNYFLVRAATMEGMPDINNFTIATLQTNADPNHADYSKAIAHFATVTGGGPTASRNFGTKTRYHHDGLSATSNNFKKTAADGTVTDDLDFTLENQTNDKSGLIFDLTIRYDGSVIIDIVDGGTGYTTDWTVTIPTSELGGSAVVKLAGTTLGLGTCRFRSLEKHPASTDNSALRLHVFDLEITSATLQDVKHFVQLHEGGSGADFTIFEVGTATGAEVGVTGSQTGKLYSNSRTSPSTIQIFPMPFTSVKSLGAESGGGAKVPRAIFKKKFRFDKDNNSDTSKSFSLGAGESLVGTTGLLTQNVQAGAVLTTNVSASGSTVTVSGLNASESDGDCNIIITIEKAQSDPGGNLSLRTKTAAFSQTGTAPFNGYKFDGYSPIHLNKADVARVYYVYDSTQDKTGTVASSGGALGSTTLTLTGEVTGITPGMQIVKTASDTGNLEPVSYGQVTAVTAAGVTPTVVTMSRPLPSAANGFGITLFNNLLDQFNFDDGQRDSYYAESTLSPSSAMAAVNNLKIKFKYYAHGAGDYFTIDSLSGDEKASYSRQYKHIQLRDSIDFRPVKAVTNGTNAPVLGKEFSTGTGGITGKSPAEGQRLVSDIVFYLPKIVKIVVTKEGDFQVVEGLAALNPAVPEDKINAMTLFTVKMKGYMYRPLPEKDFNVTTHSYKRYQMKDIATLDDRVRKLEYYTSLNFLESAASNHHMVDSAGNPMFKNGIFVDSFKGHNMANVNHPDYLNSIDRAAGVLRPHSNTKNVLLRRYANDLGASGVGTEPKQSKIAEKNSIFTLPYTNSAFIKQPYAADSIKVNPYNIFTWGGTMTLSPDSDEWVDTYHRPDIIVDQVGVYNSLLAVLEEENTIGTVWNHWETTHTGVERISSVTSTQLATSNFDRDGSARAMSTSTGTLKDDWRSGTQTYDNMHIDVNALVNDPNGEWHEVSAGYRGGMRMKIDQTVTSEVTFHNQTRDGFRNDIVIDTRHESKGSKVVETQILPFIRPRIIHFKAEQLKPNTKFYPFFDGIDVSAYCKSSTADRSTTGYRDWLYRSDVRSIYQYNRSSLTGTSPLITDSSGKVFGTFLIPNSVRGLRFKAGTRQFRLSDDISNNPDNELSYAEENYYAAGKVNHMQETIHTTRVPRIETTQLHYSVSRVIREEAVVKTTQTVKYIDPLAQTFICDQPGGMFTTKLDLFVADADKTGQTAEKGSIPLRVGLRLVENGIPTQKIIPGSDVTVYYSAYTAGGHQASALVVGDTYTIKSIGDANWSNAGWVASQVGPNGDKHTSSPQVGDSFVCIHATAGGGGSTSLARAENTCYESDITDDANVACPITFEHPVYLTEGTEYAIVLIASSEQWKVFFSETGRLDITGSPSTPAAISKQPYNGVFFTSQNASTWTPHQLRDLKFNLYRASFDVNASTTANNYKANFVNDTVESDRLITNPFTYIAKPDGATTVIRVHHKNHGLYTGNQVGAASSTKNSTVVFEGCVTENAITATNLNRANGYLVHDIEHDSYCITVPGQATTLDIRGGGDTIFASGNTQFNNLYVYSENFQPNGTNLSSTILTTAGRSMDGDRVSRNGQAMDYNDVPSSIITLNTNTPLEFPCLVASEKNEALRASLISSTFDKKSLGLTISFTNKSEFLSPVIDARRFSLFATQNRISDPGTYNEFGPDGVTANTHYATTSDITAAVGTRTASSSSTQASYYNNTANRGRFYVPGTTAFGTDDINNYITKQVVLENNATELRVLANVLRPFDSNVHLYFKTSPNPDAAFDLLPWTYASPTNEISVEVGFDNVEWVIKPSKSFTVFAMKIVLSGKDSSNVPFVRNFRAIAAT